MGHRAAIRRRAGVVGRDRELAPDRAPLGTITICTFPDRPKLEAARARINARDMPAGLRTGPHWTLVGRSLETPPSNAAASTHDLDHVINLVMMSDIEPLHSERFLEATKGVAAGAGARREGWLEILAQHADDPGEYAELFLSRYPTLEDWQDMHASTAGRRTRPSSSCT